MRGFLLLLLLRPEAPALAQNVEISVRPDTIYVESIAANVVPMERVFFHIVVHNALTAAIELEWLRFDIANSSGILFSGQYSGKALTELFDSAIDRKRIAPTKKGTLVINPDERKAISDVFLDLPRGFIGESLIVEVDYKSQGKGASQTTSAQLK